MLQSKQYYMPQIIFQKDTNSFIKLFKNFDLVLLSDKNGSRDIHVNAKSILYIVGPGGGFDKGESESLKNNGAILFSLGCTRLQSETAAICGTTKIRTLYKQI